MDRNAIAVFRWNIFVGLSSSCGGWDLANDGRYVAMHAMQEDSHEHSHNSSNGYTDGGSAPRTKPKPQMKDTLAAVGGMLIPLLTQIGHHH